MKPDGKVLTFDVVCNLVSVTHPGLAVRIVFLLGKQIIAFTYL
jgi:hypothetical protein